MRNDSTGHFPHHIRTGRFAVASRAGNSPLQEFCCLRAPVPARPPLYNAIAHNARLSINPRPQRRGGTCAFRGQSPRRGGIYFKQAAQVVYVCVRVPPAFAFIWCRGRDRSPPKTPVAPLKREQGGPASPREGASPRAPGALRGSAAEQGGAGGGGGGAGLSWGGQGPRSVRGCGRRLLPG